MSDTEYIVSPINSDYLSKNNEAIRAGINFSNLSKRILSNLGSNTKDSGIGGFKFFETTLFSNKNMSFREDDISSLDSNFFSTICSRENVEYNVIRFKRNHNIRSFDFILTFIQYSEWGKLYKSKPITKQFIGSILLSGCSKVKDNNTYEYLPLELRAKYESVGDSIGSSESFEGAGDSKGGPSITVNYSYDSEYIYIFVSNIFPFRLIPTVNGEYEDISYAEDLGSFIGEEKKKIVKEKNLLTGESSYSNFVSNKNVFFDIFISIRDNTIVNTDGDIQTVSYNDLNVDIRNVMISNSKNIVISPTNNGEENVIGISPVSNVNLEVGVDIKPISFGSRLLNDDMSKVIETLSKIESYIKNMAIPVDTIPFEIKTIIKNKGKYNIINNSFKDGETDSFGEIVITDIGTYCLSTDTFDITEYIFDKNNSAGLDSVENFKIFTNCASVKLSSILKDGSLAVPVRKTNKVLDIISNVDFKNTESFEMYSEISYIRSSTNMDVIKSFFELGKDIDSEFDSVIYFCKDNTVKIVDFKDYDMKNLIVNHIFKDFEKFSQIVINDVERIYNSETKRYHYFIATNFNIYKLIFTDYNTLDIVEISLSDYSGEESILEIKKIDDLLVCISSIGTVYFINSLDSKVLSKRINLLYSDESIKTINIDNNNLTFVTNKRIIITDYTKVDEYQNKIIYDKPFGDIVKSSLSLNFDNNGFDKCSSLQIGNDAYFFGIYESPSGSHNVYKKMNLITGDIKNLSVPDVKLPKTKPMLSYSEGKIYCLYNDDSLDIDGFEILKNIFMIYDIHDDIWINKSELTFDIQNPSYENDSLSRKIINAKFIATPSGVFVFKPQVKYYIRHPVSGELSVDTIFDNCGYMFIITEDSIVCEHIPLTELDSNIRDANASLYPIRYAESSDSVECVCGLRKISDSGDIFEGYNFYKLTIALDTFSVTQETFFKNCLEFDYMYGSSPELSRIDAFSFSDIVLHNDKIVSYVMNNAVLIIDYNLFNSENMFVRLLTHSSTDENISFPLLKDKTFSIRDIRETVLFSIDNIILFCGGNINQFDFFDLETLSFIPNPLFGMSDDSYRLIENNINDSLRIVPTKEGFYSSFSSVMTNDAIYACAKKKIHNIFQGRTENDSEDLYLFKKELGKDNELVCFDKITIPLYKSDKIRLYIVKHMLFIIPEQEDNLTVNLNMINYIYCYNLKTGEYAQVYSIENYPKDVINRFIITNEFFGELYFGIVDYDNIEKVSFMKFIVRDNTVQLVRTNDLYDLHMPNLYDMVNRYRINDSFSFGTNTLITTDKSLYAIDVDSLHNNVSLNEDNVVKILDFEECLIYRHIHYNNGYIYIDGGVTKTGTSLPISYRICAKNIQDKINDIDVRVDYEYSILSKKVSSIFSPTFIDSKSNERMFFTNIIPFKEKYICNIDYSKQKNLEDVYVTNNNLINIKRVNSSQMNRHSPLLRFMRFGENEIFIMFGGKQGTETEISKEVDAFDISTMSWFSLPSLPERIKKVSIINNIIYGATKVNDEGVESGYSISLKLICNDFNNRDFEWLIDESFINVNVPVYSKYLNIIHDANIRYKIILETDENDKLINSEFSNKVYKLEDGIVEELSIPAIPTNIGENDKLLALVPYNNQLSFIAVLYYSNTNMIYCWKYINGIGWTNIGNSVFENTLPVDRCSIDTCYHPQSLPVHTQSFQTKGSKVSISYLEKETLETIYICFDDTFTSCGFFKYSRYLHYNGLINKSSFCVSINGNVCISDVENNRQFVKIGCDVNGYSLEKFQPLSIIDSAIDKSNYCTYENNLIRFIKTNSGFELQVIDLYTNQTYYKSLVNPENILSENYNNFIISVSGENLIIGCLNGSSIVFSTHIISITDVLDKGSYSFTMKELINTAGTDIVVDMKTIKSETSDNFQIYLKIDSTTEESCFLKRLNFSFETENEEYTIVSENILTLEDNYHNRYLFLPISYNDNEFLLVDNFKNTLEYFSSENIPYMEFTILEKINKIFKNNKTIYTVSNSDIYGEEVVVDKYIINNSLKSINYIEPIASFNKDIVKEDIIYNEFTNSIVNYDTGYNIILSKIISTFGIKDTNIVKYFRKDRYTISFLKEINSDSSYNCVCRVMDCKTFDIIKENVLSLDSLDNLGLPLIYPFFYNNSINIIDTINNSIQLISFSEDNIFYYIDCLTGNVIRQDNTSILSNTNILNFCKKYSENKYLLYSSDKVYSFDTITKDIVEMSELNSYGKIISIDKINKGYILLSKSLTESETKISILDNDFKLINKAKINIELDTDVRKTYSRVLFDKYLIGLTDYKVNVVLYIDTNDISIIKQMSNLSVKNINNMLFTNNDNRIMYNSLYYRDDEINFINTDNDIYYNFRKYKLDDDITVYVLYEKTENNNGLDKIYSCIKGKYNRLYSLQEISNPSVFNIGKIFDMIFFFEGNNIIFYNTKYNLIRSVNNPSIDNSEVLRLIGVESDKKIDNFDNISKQGSIFSISNYKILEYVIINSTNIEYDIRSLEGFNSFELSHIDHSSLLGTCVCLGAVLNTNNILSIYSKDTTNDKLNFYKFELLKEDDTDSNIYTGSIDNSADFGNDIKIIDIKDSLCSITNNGRIYIETFRKNSRINYYQDNEILNKIIKFFNDIITENFIDSSRYRYSKCLKIDIDLTKLSSVLYTNKFVNNTSVYQKKLVDFDIVENDNINNITFFDKDALDNITYVTVEISNKRLFDFDRKVNIISNKGNKAFVSLVGENEMIRMDKTIIDDSCEVVLGEKYIDIRLDEERFIYSEDTNNYPFDNDILPAVMIYSDKNNLINNRYILFTDVKGNVSTFDKIGKKFIDIGGEIDVSVPFFSSELFIYPSKIVKLGSKGIRVWSYSTNSPYITNDESVDKISIEDNSLLN